MKPADLLDHNSVFCALARLSGVGVLIVTSERELAFINDRARQLLHCQPEDSRAACWSATRTLVEPTIEKANAASNTPTQETVHDCDGSHRQHLRLDVYPLPDETAAQAGHLVLVNDHDAFQRVEQSLHLALQMHHNGQLYEALAHDLRQPIGAILIHLKVLEELDRHTTHDETHDLHFRESIDTIRSEVQELDHSLRLLLRELSPSDSKEAICLREVVQGVARLLQPQTHKEGLVLRTEITDEDLAIRGRRFRIKQAVLNLATNAIEAMKAGTLTLRLHARGNRACIEVTDEGSGIPEDVQARMFERHYTTKKDGSGLGLHIVQQTAQSHDGEVRVQSTPGEGTTFELILPLHTSDEAA